MKNFAAFLFLILPTVVFAQDHEHKTNYEVEGYSRPKVEKKQINPDWKTYDGIEELENKNPHHSEPSSSSTSGSKTKETHRAPYISIKVSYGLEGYIYTATENHGWDCLEPWSDTVLEYFHEYFAENKMDISSEQLESGYCLSSEYFREE